MPRIEAVRTEIQRLLHAVPFRSFVLMMENGERVIIKHLENIAFDPGSSNGTSGSEGFYVISNRLRLFSTFSAVTSVALLDRGELAG